MEITITKTSTGKLNTSLHIPLCEGDQTVNLAINGLPAQLYWVYYQKKPSLFMASMGTEDVEGFLEACDASALIQRLLFTGSIYNEGLHIEFYRVEEKILDPIK